MHRACNHKMTDAAVKKLKNYVEAGGYLFTEDWNMPDILERAWPRLVGTGSYLPEGKVDVAPARGATTHPMLRGVFATPKKPTADKDKKGKKDDAKPKDSSKKNGTTVAEEEKKKLKKKAKEQIKKQQNEWMVDDESPYILVKDKRNVVILMTSQKVAQQSGGGHGTVALTFGGPDAYGKGEASGGLKGRVIHVISHFARQHAKEDGFALQNLALNFLLESRQRRIRAKKK